jgi:hypothetical protein
LDDDDDDDELDLDDDDDELPDDELPDDEPDELSSDDSDDDSRARFFSAALPEPSLRLLTRSASGFESPLVLLALHLIFLFFLLVLRSLACDTKKKKKN